MELAPRLVVINVLGCQEMGLTPTKNMHSLKVAHQLAPTSLPHIPLPVNLIALKAARSQALKYLELLFVQKLFKAKQLFQL